MPRLDTAGGRHHFLKFISSAVIGRQDSDIRSGCHQVSILVHAAVSSPTELRPIPISAHGAFCASFIIFFIACVSFRLSLFSSRRQVKQRALSFVEKTKRQCVLPHLEPNIQQLRSCLSQGSTYVPSVHCASELSELDRTANRSSPSIRVCPFIQFTHIPQCWFSPQNTGHRGHVLFRDNPIQAIMMSSVSA